MYGPNNLHISENSRNSSACSVKAFITGLNASTVRRTDSLTPCITCFRRRAVSRYNAAVCSALSVSRLWKASTFSRISGGILSTWATSRASCASCVACSAIISNSLMLSCILSTITTSLSNSAFAAAHRRALPPGGVARWVSRAASTFFAMVLTSHAFYKCLCLLVNFCIGFHVFSYGRVYKLGQALAPYPGHGNNVVVHIRVKG